MTEIHKIHPCRSSSQTNLKYKHPTTKRQLALDFHNCCGYCGDSHHYTGGINSYHIDHFAPKSKFNELKDDYNNFVYSCPFCNQSKSNKWVGSTASENIVDGRGFVDPCDLNYSLHLQRNKDGSISYKTTIGEFMYYELKLYLARHKFLNQLGELRDKIILIEKKITEKRKLNKDIKKLQELRSILCEAHFHYWNSYCEDLDNF